ncbi:hypothetical protein ACW0JT_17285 [Arthrobacter sp. SA17]
MALREKLRRYLRRVMRDAHERGTPVMRGLFLEFPDDPRTWEIHMMEDRVVLVQSPIGTIPVFARDGVLQELIDSTVMPD